MKKDAKISLLIVNFVMMLLAFELQTAAILIAQISLLILTIIIFRNESKQTSNNERRPVRRN